MIDFVEELPAEWQSQWELIPKTAGRMPENMAGMFALASLAILFPLCRLTVFSNIVKLSKSPAHALKIGAKVPRQD
jgi:hypothetical protein